VSEPKLVTVICGTDREDSNSLRVANLCAGLIRNEGAEARVLNLRDVRPEWLAQSAYGQNVAEFEAISDRFIRPVTRMVIVVPEYNGSFPGILKYMIDAGNYGDWAGKKVALVGLATGRGGNLRGVDHLTGIFHYLRSEVLSTKVYLSQVGQKLSPDGSLNDPQSMTELGAQAKNLLNF
jgi:chromate reductase